MRIVGRAAAPPRRHVGERRALERPLHGAIDRERVDDEVEVRAPVRRPQQIDQRVGEPRRSAIGDGLRGSAAATREQVRRDRAEIEEAAPREVGGRDRRVGVDREGADRLVALAQREDRGAADAVGGERPGAGRGRVEIEGPETAGIDGLRPRGPAQKRLLVAGGPGDARATEARRVLVERGYRGDPEHRGSAPRSARSLRTPVTHHPRKQLSTLARRALMVWVVAASHQRSRHARMVLEQPARRTRHWPRSAPHPTLRSPGSRWSARFAARDPARPAPPRARDRTCR